ncbi:MAG: hypothetical protein LBJ48_07925 [Coriobacteriales bacterium]|jgi:hypothetical protein|nr:hypothetical protein [Coriobacteriales bacterium]
MRVNANSSDFSNNHRSETECEASQNSELETTQCENGYLARNIEQELFSAQTDMHNLKSADERIAELFELMKPQRKVLLSILNSCYEKQPVHEINLLVATVQKDNVSVYSAARFCLLLEEAGALARCTYDDDSLKMAVASKPEADFEDCEDYYDVDKPNKVLWLTTLEGRAFVEADNFQDRLLALFLEEETYLPIYKQVLTLCSREEGASLSDISGAIKESPLLKEPPLHAAYFAEKLEKSDALVWKKSWHITDTGKEALLRLGDVVYAQTEDAREVVS